MYIKNSIKLAGSIGGQTGSGSGSIPGSTGRGEQSIPRKSANSNNRNSECIILESLNHKDNIIHIQRLRGWRDDVLLKSKFGSRVVKIYYYISPKLVKLSKRIPAIKMPVAVTSIAISNLI
ncbi:MAG: CFI-box-CTERM domain-containing protein [Clostridium sp.]|uniref:CFI-box-CTERM domain-containing protein n=1 Tax=Clostridium sp. TaxID=1506 RepID=UPI0039ED3927